MTRDLELSDRQPNRFWQPQLKYKILTCSGILSKSVTCVGYTTSHFIPIESIFRPVVSFKRYSSVRISLLPIICCTTSLSIYSSTCTVRLIFRWSEILLEMELVLWHSSISMLSIPSKLAEEVLLLIYIQVVPGWNLNWGHSLSWLRLIGCSVYSLLANVRVRSLQEGGNHETSSYSKGGVKIEGIWKQSEEKCLDVRYMAFSSYLIFGLSFN